MKALQTPEQVFKNWKIDYSLYGVGADQPPGGRPPGLCYNNEAGQLECTQHPAGYYVGWFIVTLVTLTMFYSLVRSRKEGTS